MLYQSFSEHSIKRVLRPADFFLDESLRTIDDLEPFVASAVEIANAENPELKSLSKIVVRSKDVYRFTELQDQLVLRKLNDTLRRVFKTRQSDRNYICKNIKCLLDEKVPFQLIKCDIANFYESVPRESIRVDVARSSIFSPEVKRVFQSIFQAPGIKDAEGLPRGLSLSSTLAEKYLESFDKAVKRIPEVYFYGRFVDDIAIFCSRNAEVILRNIQKELDKLRLRLNGAKSRIYESRKVTPSTGAASSEIMRPDFDFLGYQFSKKNFSRPADVRIADSKVKKIKTQVVHSFLGYVKDGDAHLLEDRLSFLTGNYFVRLHSSQTPLRSGIFYSYPLADAAETQLRQLDQFLASQLMSQRNIPQRRNRPTQITWTPNSRVVTRILRYDPGR